VPRDTELEDPQDLRAEIGKCPISTNERKNMSTKTLRKRIALVAVATLGAGVLSATPAFAANLMERTSATGICVAYDATTGAAEAIAVDSGEVVLTVGGTLLITSDTADLGVRLAKSGIAQVTATTGGAGVDANGLGVSTDVDATETVTITARSVGTTKVEVFVAATPGTVTEYFYITVVAGCTTNTISVADSFVSVEATSIKAVDNVDASPVIEDEGTGFLSVVGANEYGNDVPAGTWVVSATNGALVSIADTAAATAAAATLSQAILTGIDGDDIRTAVVQGADNEGKALTTVVTITYNGVKVAEKTFLFTGDLAKIEVTSVGTATTNDQNFKSFKTRAFDAAGNQLAWADAALTVTGVDSTNVTAADAGITIVNDYQWATNTVTCGPLAKATTKLKVKGLTNAGTYVYSDEFSVSCAKTPYTWTASMDKASYVPGDIAVVTISAKDSNGSVVADPYDTDNAGALPDTFSYVYGSAGTAPTVTGSNLTAVVAPAAADYFVGGVKKYSFTVGSTEGDYNLSVVLGGITTDVAKTVKYSIKSSSTAVSNADVLKAIVSLIASINKQIAALQKALLKK
jgi:hypothetical protein